MGPINYEAMMAQTNPVQDFMKGLQSAEAIQGLQLQNQERERKVALAKSYQTDLLDAFQSPTPERFAALVAKYPEQREALTKSWEMQDEATRRTEGQAMAQAYTAALAGRNDVVQNMLRQRIEAKTNSGLDASHEQNLLKIASESPAQLQAALGFTLSHTMDPKTFATTFKALGEEGRATQQAPADMRKKVADATTAEAQAAVAPQKAQADLDNIVSQIADRAARLGLDRDTLATNTKIKLLELKQKTDTLDTGAAKIVNESAAAATGADAAAAQMLSLADRLEQAGGGYGAAARAAEWLAGATGKQDAMTSLRQEYTRLRNSAAVKMLPPGPATDKDIALAMKGFPEDTADAKFMASFLRGMAKIQQREAAAESAKAEWVGAVGHLGKPKTDIEIDGIKVPAGTSYVDFTRQYLDKRTAARAQAQGAQQIQQRSYMRFAAQPAPGAPGALGTGTYGMGGQ